LDEISETPVDTYPEIHTELSNSIQKIQGLLTKFSNNILSLQKKRSEKGLETLILNNATIIFATLSVTGRKSMRKMYAVHTLIVDEAAQSVEAETLIPLVYYKPSNILLVGDTKQLPASVNSTLSVQKHFDWSMMWRLIEECKQPYNILEVQYRMDPAIRQWPSFKYYGDRLIDDQSINDRENFVTGHAHSKPILGPFSVIDIKSKEKEVGTSRSNQIEADAVVTLLNYLHTKLKIDLAKQVGVITFYAEQAALLEKKIKLYPKLRKARISTVDGFQGDEKDIIIISCVRANYHGNIGFLKDFRRLNVAITRAKHALIIIGNVRNILKKSSDIAELFLNAKKRSLVYGRADLLELKPGQGQFNVSKGNTFPYPRLFIRGRYSRGKRLGRNRKRFHGNHRPKPGF